MRSLIGALCLFATASCGLDPVGPKTEYNGVKYTATSSFVPILGFVVLVKMENLTTETVTRTYPSGCAVRIRLYRPIDGKRVYDETQWPCIYNTPATIQLTSRSTYQLSSGGRSGMLGDSLPGATYIVHGVVMTEGTTPVEVNAGEVAMNVAAASPLIRPGSAVAVSFGAGRNWMERGTTWW
jgi:hypothetical protein